METTKTLNTYPPNWSDISRLVRQRAGGRCVRCRHPSGDYMASDTTITGLRYWPIKKRRVLAPCDEECEHPRDGKLRVLTVHHLDGDKGNCRWWNLPALCQVCHLVIQAKVKLDQSYMHPHSEWFLPYVAGFYAFAVLGEQLEREEVDRRLPELIAAGQPWLVEQGLLPEATR